MFAIVATSGLPLGDWQFWVVTAIALAGVTLVVRPLLPSSKSSTTSCTGCGGAGGGSKRSRAAKATLTIGGESPSIAPGKGAIR
ncbi:MAG: hypothetical protein ACYTFH_08375 [Planctomycetota bacterium]